MEQQWLQQDGAPAMSEMKRQRRRSSEAATTPEMKCSNRDGQTEKEQIWRENDRELAVVCRLAKIRRERELRCEQIRKGGREDTVSRSGKDEERAP